MSAETPKAGHNGIAVDRLLIFIQRVERLESEKAALVADIREVYAEAKSNGFDTKIMRKIVVERRLDEQERREQEELLDLYRQALGQLASTPLGKAALGTIGRGVVA